MKYTHRSHSIESVHGAHGAEAIHCPHAIQSIHVYPVQFTDGVDSVHSIGDGKPVRYHRAVLDPGGRNALEAGLLGQ